MHLSKQKISLAYFKVRIKSSNFEVRSKSGDKIWITPIKVIFLKKCHLLKQNKKRASKRTPSPFQSTKPINQWTICIFHHRVRLRWFLVQFPMRWGFYPRRSQCNSSYWPGQKVVEPHTLRFQPSPPKQVLKLPRA